MVTFEAQVMRVRHSSRVVGLVVLLLAVLVVSTSLCRSPCGVGGSSRRGVGTPLIVLFIRDMSLLYKLCVLCMVCVCYVLLLLCYVACVYVLFTRMPPLRKKGRRGEEARGRTGRKAVYTSRFVRVILEIGRAHV